MRQRHVISGLAGILCVHVAVVSLGVPTATRPATTQPNGQAALRVSVELASDISAQDDEAFEKSLRLLHREVRLADYERVVAFDLLTATPQTPYAELVAAEGQLGVDYLWAMRHSYARLRAAQHAGDKNWIAKHTTAIQKYSTLAAKAFRAQTQTDLTNVATLKARPYAVRRPAAKTTAFLDAMQRDGLRPDHLKLLADSGRTEQEIAAYQKRLLTTPPTEVGISMVEMLKGIAAFRGEVASKLERFAARPDPDVGPMSNTYTVFNPYDTPQTVNLLIRRVAVPPEWQLTVIDAEPPPADGTAARQVLYETEPGVRYALNLPAKGQRRVHSVLLPQGDVGQNTTARWAVEGYIGNELLGGMMHELAVPTILPDLVLPNVTAPGGAVALTAAASNLSRAAVAEQGGRRTLLWVSLCSTVLIIVLVIVMRQRRRTVQEIR